MKKILFGITNLEIGGAEQVLVNLVNLLASKYDITILTLYNNGILEKDVNKKVKIISILDKKYEDMNIIEKKLFALKIKVPYLRNQLYKKYIKNKYDVEIAFLEGPITELLQCSSNAKKIAWIHTDLKSHYPESRYKELLNMYSYYDNLVFVSQLALDKFNEIDESKIYKGNKEIIYNYMDFDVIRKKSTEKITDKFSNDLNFVVVARLVHAKGLDRLLSVHKKLIEDGLKHHIYIVGDGPEKENLLNIQKEYKVEDTFIFLGQKKNPYPYIKACDYFILPSYYEGYGLVCLEAMALNQYVISTNNASCEVLKDYPNKTIVENNEQAIYEGLKEIIKEKKIRNKKSYEVKSNDEILNKICKLIGDE